MNALFSLIDTVLWLYMLALIGSALLSWLVAFGVVNTRNRLVYIVGDFLHRSTEPVLAPIRRFLPNLGGIDISPLVVILLVIFARQFLRDLFF